MTPGPTCRLVTLGCKVNQYETQYVKEALEAQRLPRGGRGRAGRPVRRQHLHRHRRGRRQEPAARPPAAPGQSAGRDRRHGLLRHARSGRGGAAARRDAGHHRQGELARGAARLRRRRPCRPASRASTAISGRSSRCRTAACSIARYLHHPHGSAASCAAGRSDEIADEVARLVAGGYPEIVLTGIHLGHYGIDLSRGRPKSGMDAGCGTCSNGSTGCRAISAFG